MGIKTVVVKFFSRIRFKGQIQDMFDPIVGCVQLLVNPSGFLNIKTGLHGYQMPDSEIVYPGIKFIGLIFREETNDLLIDTVNITVFYGTA